MNNHKSKDIPDNPPEKSCTWNEYARFHDRFVEQLSYHNKGSYQKTNVWDYCYL